LTYDPPDGGGGCRQRGGGQQETPPDGGHLLGQQTCDDQADDAGESKERGAPAWSDAEAAPGAEQPDEGDRQREQAGHRGGCDRCAAQRGGQREEDRAGCEHVSDCTPYPRGPAASGHVDTP